MRILGITQKWDKLKQPRWTTFRLQRRDRDWEVGELVQVVYKPRNKEREVLGIAKIIAKELKRFSWTVKQGMRITPREAQEDGFADPWDMYVWMKKAHGPRIDSEPINKLTLEWVNG